MRKSVVMAVGVLAVAGIAIVVMFLLNADQRAWDDAVKAGTVKSVRDYLKQYPSGEHVKDAHARIEELSWRAAEATGDPIAIAAFLAEYPKGAHVPAALAAQDRIAWEQASKAGNVEALRDFVHARPKSPHRDAALQQIGSLEWEKARAAGSVAAVDAFLKAHGDGEHAADARKLRDELEWKQLLANGSAADLVAYLKRRPEGAHVAAAKARILELEWDAAKETRTIASVERFLSEFPASEHDAAASSLLEDLYWEQARATDTPDAYARFTERFSESRRRDEAEKLRVAAQWQVRLVGATKLQLGSKRLTFAPRAVTYASYKSFPKQVAIARGQVVEGVFVEIQRNGDRATATLNAETIAATGSNGAPRKLAGFVVLNVPHDSAGSAYGVVYYNNLTAKGVKYSASRTPGDYLGKAKIDLVGGALESGRTACASEGSLIRVTFMPPGGTPPKSDGTALHLQTFVRSKGKEGEETKTGLILSLFGKSEGHASFEIGRGKTLRLVLLFKAGAGAISTVRVMGRILTTPAAQADKGG